MSETNNYDSKFVGYVDEPKYNANGELMSWTIKIKDHELKDILDNYITKRNDAGQGGNAVIRLLISKSGKPYATVYDPNSQAANDKRAAAAAKKPADDSADELPF